jgi:hypothetical protein
MASDSHDAPRHAGQVVRRVLLRRNIAIDAETAQLVAAAVQAARSRPAPPARVAALAPFAVGRDRVLPAADTCRSAKKYTWRVPLADPGWTRRMPLP